MSRKDFKVLADALSVVRPPADNGVAIATWRTTVERVSIALHEHAPRFDREKFLKAAGYWD